ncbi:MAG: CoA transferase [Dehalococcoidia bacterium]|nr:CoA transferase [Dehalococcoidia bacterium]
MQGVKVLDFCWVVAGPMATKSLAEFGATVVRVESSKRPETLRRAAPFRGREESIDRSAYFANYNANKHGITIDMGHPQARDLILRMVLWADVVTENFTPGTMPKWGLGYADLKKVNPGLVMFSTSMLGRGGPMESQPGYGPVLTSLSGLTHITGWPDRDPVNPHGPYTDFIGPRFAVAAILAGLDHSRRTGKGVHLDMSQLESALHFSAPLTLDRAVNGRDQGRRGNRDPGAAPHGVYPCKGEDRWIAIACTSDEQWQAFRLVIAPDGRGWAHQERFSSLLGRKSSEDELERMVGEWTAPWDARELMDTLQRAGVPAGVVNDCRDLFDDPQLKHRGHYQFLDHPELGVYATEGTEMVLSRTPGSLETASPLMGQHTEQVFRELFGFSAEEYNSLKEDGMFE